jgi:ketosteroid isomerase-like protein
VRVLGARLFRTGTPSAEEWELVRAEPNRFAVGGEAAVYRGHEGIRQGLRDLFEVLRETHLEYPEIRDLGDRVIGIGHMRTRARESGAETEAPHATVVDVKDGKAIRIRAYFDVKEALEAAGLSG